ncbi:hypothetical protein MTO96_033959 [Rhipicephalus appendiculatus]
MSGVYAKVYPDLAFGDLEDDALPVELRRVAEAELGETPAKKRDALAALTQLLQVEPDLNANKDAKFLLRFLRVRKYNVDATLKTIRNYYKNRASCPSLYNEFVPHNAPPEGRKLVMVLPEKDVHGRPVLLCKPGKYITHGSAWITSKLSYEDFHRTWLLCMEHLAADPAAQVVGVALLLDYAGFTADKVLSLRPGLLRRAVEYVQDCMPMRMKAAHIVRQHYAFDMLFAIIRPFIKAKLAERVHLHGANFEKLHEHISPVNLPAQYGGQGPPLDHDEFWKQVDDEEGDFIGRQSFRLRLEKPEWSHLVTLEQKKEFTPLL